MVDAEGERADGSESGTPYSVFRGRVDIGFSPATIMPAESQVPKASVVGEPSGSTSQSEGSIQVPSVDEIVQDQAFYIKLCDEQSEFFKQNIAEF